MIRYVLIALLSLATGALVYGASRDAAHAQWIPAMPLLAGAVSFGSVGEWLPSLTHVLGFSLLSALLVPPWARLAACALWCAVDLAFEIGQHPGISPWLTQALQDVAADGPGARALGRYFAQGTFDPHDLLACIAGGVLAALIVQQPSPRRADVHHAL